MPVPVEQLTVNTLPSLGSVQYDRNRAAVIDSLFVLDGRADHAHPRAWTYTALAEDYRERIGPERLEEITRRWHRIDGPAALSEALQTARKGGVRLQVPISTPMQQVNAVVAARDFFLRMSDPKKMPKIPREVRREARSLLRHYPLGAILKPILEEALAGVEHGENRNQS